MTKYNKAHYYENCMNFQRLKPETKEIIRFVTNLDLLTKEDIENELCGWCRRILKEKRLIPE